MISHIKDFEFLWMQEFDKTQKVFKHIPDRALAQAVDSAGRTLGRLAWHIATTIPEMMGQTGLRLLDRITNNPFRKACRRFAVPMSKQGCLCSKR